MSLEILRRLKALERAVEILRTRDGPPRWVDWTPTVTQSSQQGVTVTEAKYAKIGDICHAYAKLVVTSSGTAGQWILVGGIPAAIQIATTGLVVGGGRVVDTGTASYFGLAESYSTAVLVFNDTNDRTPIGGSPSFALANTDTIDFTATWRVAT